MCVLRVKDLRYKTKIAVGKCLAEVLTRHMWLLACVEVCTVF